MQPPDFSDIFFGEFRIAAPTTILCVAHWLKVFGIYTPPIVACMVKFGAVRGFSVDYLVEEFVSVYALPIAANDTVTMFIFPIWPPPTEGSNFYVFHKFQ